MEEVRFLSVETRNEAGEDLRYPCFYSKGVCALGAAAASWRCL